MKIPISSQMVQAGVKTLEESCLGRFDEWDLGVEEELAVSQIFQAMVIAASPSQRKKLIEALAAKPLGHASSIR